jgi:hypothetical protein
MDRPTDPFDGAGGRTAVVDGQRTATRDGQVYRSIDTGTYVDRNVMEVKNRVQWGPIIAGTITALVTMLLLSILGLAIGSSAFEPGTDASDWGTGAGIWGAISAVIALFLGGWVAAKTAAVGGKFAGMMSGFMAGAATILVVLWLTTTGITNLLGFLGNNVADIAAVASETVTGDTVTTGEVEGAVDDAQAQVEDASISEETFDRVANGAWGTLIALVIALGAAAVGGMIGYNQRQDLVEGTGTT